MEMAFKSCEELLLLSHYLDVENRERNTPAVPAITGYSGMFIRYLW
jgi:hypothetical protein